MPLPQFSNDEQYIINYVKSPTASSQSSPYMWGYILGGIVVAGFAAYFDSMLMMAATFVAICGFRIYEERHQLKWMPVWRSIIDKYEAAALANSPEHTNDSGSQSRP